MNFLLLSLASLALVNAASLKLESADPQFNNKGLAGVDFGEGITGVLVADSNLYFQQTGSTVFLPGATNSTAVPLGSLNGELVFSVSAKAVKVVNGYLSVNNSTEKFYACKNIAFDPYHYSANPRVFGISVHDGNAPGDCHSVKIRVD